MRGFSDDPIENRDGSDLPPCIDCDTPTAERHPVLIGEAQCAACRERDQDEAGDRIFGRSDTDAPMVAERNDAAHAARREGRR